MIVQIDDYSFAYTCFGKGTVPMICFHGYGQNKEIFDILTKKWGDIYTFYSFDLPYHGENEWSFDLPEISKKTLEKIFLAFITKEKIDTFSVLGFSIGARFALALLELFPKKLNDVYLLAPDGIQKNVGFEFLTSTFGSKLFRFLLDHPFLILLLFKIVEISGLRTKKILSFYRFELSSSQKRNRLFATWMNVKKIITPPSSILHITSKHTLRIHFVTGKYDRIIRSTQIEKIRQKIPGANHLILDSNHLTLLQTFSDTI